MSSEKRALRVLEESRGVFKAIQIGAFETVIRLVHSNGLGDLVITFPTGSPEAKILEKELKEGLVGQKLGILRINDPHNPIRIRIVPV